MMKLLKIFLVIFFIVTILQSRLIANASTVPVPTGVMMPGLNCGVMASGSGTITYSPENKCCFFNKLYAGIPKPGIIGVDQLVDGFTYFVNKFVNSGPLENINTYVDQTIEPCYTGSPSTPGNPKDPNCFCLQPTPAAYEELKYLCKNIQSSEEKKSCETCLVPPLGKAVGIWTGLGCFYTNATDFIIGTVFNFGISLAGGLSLLCIIYGAFMMQSSQGNAEKIKKAQELITSCIMGLMLIIFSIFILKLIGIDILRIPGFK